MSMTEAMTDITKKKGGTLLHADKDWAEEEHDGVAMLCDVTNKQTSLTAWNIALRHF